jgi:two-component system, OmpR family, response regulator
MIVGTALILANDPDTVSLLAAGLRLFSLNPMVFNEGKPAIAWTREHRPDVLVLDLSHTVKDADSVCQALKLDRATNLIPIIAIAKRASWEKPVQTVEVEANAYLVRPIEAKHLHEAIETALAWRADLERRGTQGEIHFQLPSASKFVDEMNHWLGGLLLFTGLSEKQRTHLILAIRELGTNAIEWGHRNRVEQPIAISYRIDLDRVTLVIRDTGPGFDPNNMPHAARPEDPISHLAVRETMGLRDGGCGILMARGLVDELTYNETGNEVRLVKYYTPIAGKHGESRTHP